MVAEATSAAGISNFVHVSALNADPNSPSSFLKSKVVECAVFTITNFFQFEGEEAVRAICPTTVVVRPANMMGDEDRYLNYFACKYYNMHMFILSFCFCRLGQNNTVCPSIETIISDIQATSLCTVTTVY